MSVLVFWLMSILVFVVNVNFVSSEKFLLITNTFEDHKYLIYEGVVNNQTK